jgi:hypothetical protein
MTVRMMAIRTKQLKARGVRMPAERPDVRGEDGGSAAKQTENATRQRGGDTPRTDVEDDELNEALARHKRSNRAALASVKALEASGNGTAAELADKGDDAEEDDVAPCFAVVEQAEVGLETGDWADQGGDVS